MKTMRVQMLRIKRNRGAPVRKGIIIVFLRVFGRGVSIFPRSTVLP